MPFLFVYAITVPIPIVFIILTRSNLNMKNVGTFLLTWVGFAVRDSFNAAFGWATLFSLAAFTYFGSKFGFSLPSGKSWTDALSYTLRISLAGFLIAFCFNLVLSFIKAWFSIKPLALSISGEIRAPDLVYNNIARNYCSTIIIKNRSSNYILDCTVHIDDLPSADGIKFSRFVERFDLPPKSTKHVYIAYWCSRDGQYPDDQLIGICGPVGAGMGGIDFQFQWLRQISE